MNRNEQIEYCSKCIHKSFNPQKGMVCGLNDLIPKLEISCSDILVDPEIEKFETWEKTSSIKTQNDYNLTAILSGIGLLIIGVGLSIFSYMNAHSGATYSIYWGAILIGLIRIFNSK